MNENQSAQSMLRLVDERYRLLIEAVEGLRDYAIFMLDPAGFILTWNLGAHRIKGYTATEALGRHFSIFYTPEDIARKHPEHEMQIILEEGKFEEEGWRVRKDGSRFWASVLITKIADSKGNVLGFSKVTRDLTERRKAEEELKRAYQDLDKRVEKRTQELSHAKVALERALSARDEFLSIASHEIKTPITTLKLQAQMLDARVHPETNTLPPAAKISTTLKSIVRQSERLSSLVDYMLDVSRAQLGRFTFRFEDTNLSEMLGMVMLQWSDALISTDSELQLKIEPEIYASVDGFRLEQVIANLISNILKYAPKSQVRVTLTTDQGFAVMRVSDNGPGIAPSEHAKIFEQYERVDRRRDITGLGLGLYISKTIVAAHSGSIEVESIPQKGATFTVRIPLSKARRNEAKL